MLFFYLTRFLFGNRNLKICGKISATWKKELSIQKNNINIISDSLLTSQNIAFFKHQTKFHFLFLCQQLLMALLNLILIWNCLKKVDLGNKKKIHFPILVHTIRTKIAQFSHNNVFHCLQCKHNFMKLGMYTWSDHHRLWNNAEAKIREFRNRFVV